MAVEGASGVEMMVQAVDVAGKPTSKYGPFWSVELTNPDREKVAAGWSDARDA